VAKARWPVTLRWEDRDAHRWAAPLALFGGVAGAAMAVFGLPPVDLHGPLHFLGVMDPLCGMTRATRLLFLGHLVRAVRYNPGAPVLVAGAMAALLRAAWGRAVGRWCTVRLARRGWAGVVWVVLAGAWEANQQAHAAMLRTTRVPVSVPPLAAGVVFAAFVAAGLWWLPRRAAAPRRPTAR
jgi:hypothetical protein